MGIGLVGFGIGGGFGGGGLFTAASNNEGAAGGASFASEIKKYKKLTEEQPSNVGRLGRPAQGAAARSGQRTVRDQQRRVTAKGKELYEAGGAGVEQLHRAEPAQAQPRTGPAMVLRCTAKKASTNPPRPSRSCRSSSPRTAESASLYGGAGRVRLQGARTCAIGDLASEKAVSLAPASETHAREEGTRRSQGEPERQQRNATRPPRTAKPTSSNRAATALHGHRSQNHARSRR